MKVLLYTNLFPNPEEPERGIFKFQLAKALNEQCELTVVSPLPWFPKHRLFNRCKKWASFSKIPSSYVLEGIKVYYPKYFMLPKISDQFHSLTITAGTYNLIRKLHERQCFDVVNSHWLYPDSVSMASIAKRLGIPHVASGSGCDVNKTFNEPFKFKKIKKALDRAEIITAISSEMQQKIIQSGFEADKVKTVLNGVNGQIFDIQNKETCRKKLSIDCEGKVFVYIGRLSEEKGVEYLIKGMREATKNNNIGKLYLIGDGDLKVELSNLISDFGLADKVHLVGPVSHELVKEWLGAADFLCLPSKREGCPNVILEALSSGTPVLASRVGAIPDLVNNTNGILFSPMSSSDIAEAIKAALEINWLPKLIRESVQSFTWTGAAQQYLNIYEEAKSQRCLYIKR